MNNVENKEWSLLLKACQSVLTAQELLVIDDIKEINWDLLLQKITLHKVTPHFTKGLKNILLYSILYPILF